jgi:uncharacterized protein YcgI (DUF1989 family)
MKLVSPEHKAPDDGGARQAKPALVCYPVETLPQPDLGAYRARRSGAEKTSEILVPPRDARCVNVPAGAFFRITSVEGSQVGDLNLWNAHDISEKFYTGKTRALHGTHLTTGDRMWSSFPTLRPMATIIDDSLDWYGFDADGGSVHDVIGTRCDPYTGKLLSGDDYHYCCHSNLTRAFADHQGIDLHTAEPYVHDVLNVFMCTGFLRSTGQYFMKASPVRPGDYIEFYAEIDLIAGLSACPGGDCGDEHTSDKAACHPLLIEVFDAAGDVEQPARNAYDRTHGRG